MTKTVKQVYLKTRERMNQMQQLAENILADLEEVDVLPTDDKDTMGNIADVIKDINISLSQTMYEFGLTISRMK